MTRTKNLNGVLLFIFTLVFSTNLFSQDLLIYEDTRSRSSLTADEERLYTVFENSQFYESLTLAKFEKIAEKQEEGVIKINIPGDDCEDLYFKATEVEYESESKYSWTGDLDLGNGDEDCYCRYGTITIVSSSHGKIAHVQIDDKVFEILELSSDTYVIGKLNESKFTEEECAINSLDNNSSIKTEQGSSPRSGGNCNVRCLVLFTPNATALEGSVAGVNNRVNLAIRQTNRALRKSAVNSCELTIELVGVLPINFMETTTIRTDLNTYSGNAAITNLRNNQQADIVVMLTDGEYGSTFGIAYIGPVDDEAFAIVQAGAATTGRYTFAHEVAHLFGALHEESDTPGGTIEHGHSFTTGGFLPCIFGHKQRTILHTLGLDGARIQHYSNPAVVFDGEKTGKNGIRENANQLRNTACTVATFRETIEPFGVYITGNDCYCPCQSTSKYAEVFNGTAGATYTFVWETSTDGFNWTTATAYTGAGVSQVMPCNVGESMFFRVTVTSSSGQVATSAVSSTIASTSCPGQPLPCIQQLVDNTNTNDVISLSPNPSPSHQESTITIRINTDAMYSISLYDINGIRHSSLVKDKFLKKGIETIIIPPLDEGIYIIEATQNKKPYSSIKMLKI